MKIIVRVFACILSAMALTGCFHPVHSTRIDEALLLEEVSIEKIDGYLGYTLKSELDYLLNGGNAPNQNGRYLLKVKTKKSNANAVINISTGLAQVISLKIEAIYTLVDRKENNKIKASGKTFISGSYDRSQLRFSSLRAEQNTEERLGKALAERLKIILMAALAREGQSSPSKVPEQNKDDDQDQILGDGYDDSR